MAQIFFTPSRDIDTVAGTEEKLRLLNDRINSLERDLTYILKNLDEENMRSTEITNI